MIMKFIKRRNKLSIFLFSLTLLLILILAILGPENISYFSQVIEGHFQVMGARESIEDLLRTDHLDIESKTKLEMILDVRAFAAKELGLPDNKSYTVYSDIDRQYLGWNVFCAPQFSVEPRKWCFPIVGCVVYRGYFSRDGALKFAHKMEEENYDVFISPINSYSTFGWYDDPLLSSHLRLNKIRLASLIIHELAHQKYYVKDDSRFNESYAVTAGRAGLLQWLKSKGNEEAIFEAIKWWEEDDQKIGNILETYHDLNDIYLSELDTMSLSTKKDSVFQHIKFVLCEGNCEGYNLPRTDNEDFSLNNAYLVSIDTYYSLVPVFQGILDSLDGNLPKFFERVEELGNLSFEERQGEIKSLQLRLKNPQK